MKKEKLDERELLSIIELNKSEVALNQRMIDLRELEFRQEKDKEQFEATSDYRNGTMLFVSEIDVGPVTQLSHGVRRLARMFPKRPIRIEMNSPGGTINSGFQMIDDLTVVGQTCPITIAVRGQAASMAAVVLQAAKTRLIGPHAYVMLHRASFGVEGSAEQIEDSIEEVKMFEKRIYEIVAKRSGKTVDFWKKQLGRRKDIWYTAEEAVKIGLADSIG